MTKEFPIPSVEDRPLYDLIWMRHALPVTALAREIGLFDHLAERPASIAEIAAHYQVTPRATEAVVAVLAALNFLQAGADGRFSLSPTAQTYLTAASPFYYDDIVQANQEMLDDLHHAFHSQDDPIRPLAVDIEQLPQEDIEDFIDKMYTLTLPAAGALAQQEIFARTHHLLDIGGGSGSLSIVSASAHPHIRCTVVDLEPICAIARNNIARYQLQDRIHVVAADMFNDPLPPGHDAALFGNIFHDWDADSCRQLAHRTFAALEPEGSILLHEMPLNAAKDGPLLVAGFSVSMLLHERGKQYTLPEFADMLSAAGFSNFHSIPTFSYYHLISAQKN